MNIAKNYGWKSNQSENSHKYLVPTVLKLLKKIKGNTLLDIGTGNGSTLPIWLDNGFNVSAIEPDKDGFEFSSKQIGADVRNLGCNSDFPNEWINNFDICISLEVVEHMFDPNELIQCVNKCLKKGGYVIISTPYHGYLKNLALAIFDKWDFHHHPNRIGGHIKFWSKKTLTKLFTDGGFEFISFDGCGRFPLLYKSMVLVFKK